MRDFFIQPWIMWGLPLIALPVIIHLINQYRHRTVQWGAMQFLLNAKRMNRGMARLKQILVLAMRVLAVAGLIFAVSRPLASGWFGVAVGGSAETTLILLDRSASMEQTDAHSGESKRQTALRKIHQLISRTGSSTRLVLIDSAGLQPHELSNADSLLDLPFTEPTATTADVPAMLQRAFDFITEDRSGRTDIWVCTDMRTADWDAAGARWAGLREAAASLETTQIYLLSYPEISPENLSVTVSNVARRVSAEQNQLLMDIRIKRDRPTGGPVKVPLGVIVNGARTVLDVEVAEAELNLQGHSLVLDRQTTQGWGRVELPGDSNQMDNDAYFVFAEAAERHTVLVTEDERLVNAIKVAVTAPAEPGLSYTAQVIAADRAVELEWDRAGMIVWQAPLPTGVLAQQLTNFVNSGRTVLFLPPGTPDENALFGVKWGAWQKTADDAPLKVATWRQDSDLLQNTQSGAPLQAGELTFSRYCAITGDGNVLARLEGNLPLLMRAPSDHGAVYFCGALPGSTYSTLAQDGIILYVMLHRALATGAAGLANAQNIEAGRSALLTVDWKRLAPTETAASEQNLLEGAFENGGRLRALNRPAREDQIEVVNEASVKDLMAGMDVQIIEDKAGGAESLANEIWRAFVVLMGLALLTEAILCLPAKRNQPPTSTPAPAKAPS